MSLSNCCSPTGADRQVNVNVNVDVPKIVKYTCVTGVLIVAIVFGTKLYRKMMEDGFFDFTKK